MILKGISVNQNPPTKDYLWITPKGNTRFWDQSTWRLIGGSGGGGTDLPDITAAGKYLITAENSGNYYATWGDLDLSSYINGDAGYAAVFSGSNSIVSAKLSNSKIRIGNGIIEWDSTNNGFKIYNATSTQETPTTAGIYADWVSALGPNSSGGGGGGGDLDWGSLIVWDENPEHIIDSNYLPIYSWALAQNKPSYTFNEIGSKPTTLSGYGITDAKIANGVITLGSNTITPVTSITVPTGFSISGTGILNVSYASGYEGFTTTLKDKIDALYSWFEIDNNGDIKTKDYIDNGVTKHRGFYSPSFISALDANSSGGGGGGGISETDLWAELTDNPQWTLDDDKIINISHLPNIDADTVDGYHASSFAFADGTNVTGTWGISISGDADTVDGYHATRFTDYNENTNGNNVNYNTLSYNRGTALTIQPLHAPNYSGQTNVPVNGYGQILTFGGYTTYFPFRIAYEYSGGNIKYQSAGYITSSSFNFGSNSWHSILTDQTYSSYALPRYNSNLTAGYIPKLSTTGQTDLANSLLSDNGTRILSSGSLEINSTGSNWSEGIRIHPSSNNWSGIILCENSNNGSTGTSANTWSIHNNEGVFGFYKNGSNTNASEYITNTSNGWGIKGSVGIGTNSPTCKLDVSGDVFIGNTSSTSHVISLQSSACQLRMYAYSDGACYVETGNSAFNANSSNSILYLAGYSASNLSKIELRANNIQCNGIIKSTVNGNTVSIGSLNASWCHIYNSANIPFIFNKNICSAGANTDAESSLGSFEYPWHVLYLGGVTNATMGNTTTNPRIVFFEGNSTVDGVHNQAVALTYTDYDSYRASKGLKVHDMDGQDPGNVWFEVQGACYCNGLSSSSYVTALATNSSDKRLKKNIKSFNAIEIVKKLKPVQFEWNNEAKKYNENFKDGKNYGLIAQDSDGIIDDFVFDLPDGKGYKGIRYEKLTPILLQAIKEQQSEINELKNIIKELKHEIFNKRNS